MSTKVLAVAGLALALFTSAGAFAAGEATADKSNEKMQAHFDSHIDSWAEGTLTTMNLDGKKFTIKGQKLPYATAHAQMTQEIQKTEGLDQAKRDEKIAEINKAWADRLEKAKGEDLGPAADFSFAFPAKGNLAIHEARDLPDIAFLHMGKSGEQQPIPASAREEKREPAKLNFSDLKIGDRVTVGFDSGILTNEAYTIIRQVEPSVQPAQPEPSR